MRDRGQRGAAVVEFAVVLPLLVVLLFGIVEFGLVLYNKQILANASREGARAGISYLAKNDISDVVVNYCMGRLIPLPTQDKNELKTYLVTNVTPDPPPSSYGQDLTVTISYDHTFLFADLLGFGPQIQLTAETVMKMEGVAGPSGP